MAEIKAETTEYKSERERKYYEEILPKLSAGIKQMNLNMRSHFVLVNSGICTVKALREVLESGQHIRMMDRDEEEYICSCLKIKFPKKDED